MKIRNWRILRLLEMGMDISDASQISDLLVGCKRSWHDVDHLMRIGMPCDQIVEEIRSWEDGSA